MRNTACCQNFKSGLHSVEIIGESEDITEEDHEVLPAQGKKKKPDFTKSRYEMLLFVTRQNSGSVISL